jgi:hypothetical protein
MRAAWLLALACPLAACSSASPASSTGISEEAGAVVDASSAVEASTDAATPPVDATLSDGGSPVADASTGPCPALMALVHAEAGLACIDLYEGALVQVEPDGGEAPWPHYTPVDDYDASAFRAVPAQGIFPQGYISQVQATAACEASGKRLCTLDEWTAACRGRPQHDYLYPYGDTFEDGGCNEGKESPIVILFGPDPTYDDTELNDPRCDQLEGGLAPGGNYSRCESAYGAFDMNGNLHEWIVDSPAGEPSNGMFLGGYFVDATENGPGCTYTTTAHAKVYHDYSTGFRCCASVSGGE